MNVNDILVKLNSFFEKYPYSAKAGVFIPSVATFYLFVRNIETFNLSVDYQTGGFVALLTAWTCLYLLCLVDKWRYELGDFPPFSSFWPMVILAFYAGLFDEFNYPGDPHWFTLAKYAVISHATIEWFTYAWCNIKKTIKEGKQF